MYFLLSGEGVTDMGSGQGAAMICEGRDFRVGPMATIVAKVVEARHGYSILSGACGYISRSSLAEHAGVVKANSKQLRLPGKKQPRETRYYFNSARILASLAMKKAAELQDEVVAVLFRDSDGTASAGRGEWAAKWDSMLQGFAEEGFNMGVPMVPKPKSEACLICAFKSQPYQNCAALEQRSGNDDSPNNLKAELTKLLGGAATPQQLVDKVNQAVAVDRIQMPSFTRFRERLEKVITSPGRRTQ